MRARRDLQVALAHKSNSSSEEQKCIVEILKRATAQINGEK